MREVKLGKLAPRHDDRTLLLARYATTPPQAPPVLNLAGHRETWPMALNDRLGDCTCAAASHMVEQWTSQTGHPTDLPDADVLAAYEAVSGYDPSTEQNDNGAAELDVLNYWRQTGIGAHRIGAFAAVNLDLEWLRYAAWIFQGLYIGAALPVNAQQQDVWDFVPSDGSAANPGSWGGHAINVVAYDENGVTVVTWGALKKATWAWVKAYIDEAWAIISPDYLSGGESPQGFDLAALSVDLATVTGQ